MTGPSAPVREGDLLAGKYRVERVLGAGGMGIVVAARHEQLDQLVAIKFVREEALANEDAVQRFLREARAAVKLKSEHVARVLDVGKLETGAPYMVMEFLEGTDLAKFIETNGPMRFDAAADFIIQACEAVAEAHAAGIVHRDLKPENMFLARTVGGVPKLKVLDFGVSKAVGAASGGLLGLTRTRTMLGSPLYMAPEQMRSSRDVDARADVWALGVVLFQILTMRWPFEADTMPELCLKVVSDPPASLGALRPDLPQPLLDVVERCLAKDPAQRYANAAELASALEPFVDPSSRVIAERARLAIGAGTGSSPQLARQMTLDASAAAGTLLSNSSGSRTPVGARTPPRSREASLPSIPEVRAPGGMPGSRTPSGGESRSPTSGAWAEPSTGAPIPSRPSRTSWMFAAAGAIAAVGVVAVVLAVRAPAPAGPVPSAAAPPPEATVASKPPAPSAVSPPSPAPTSEALRAPDPEVPPAPSASAAQPAPVASAQAPAPAPGPQRTAAPAAHKPAPQPSGKAAAPDDDIPTIR